MSSQKQRQQSRALALMGSWSQWQGLDPHAGRQSRGHPVLPLKMERKIIRAAFLCGEKRGV